MARIAWGQKVSSAFLDSVVWIVNDLDIGDNTADGVNKLMTCMAWESGRTFSPSVVNKAGSGATGLIQFMPDTAAHLGTTTAKLAKMTAEQQLNYVWKYFAPYKGKLRTLGDLYMAILWPKGVGKPETYVLWNKSTQPTTYRQNSGLDMSHDGSITKLEATTKVAALLAEGLRDKYALDADLPDGERNEAVPLAAAISTDIVEREPEFVTEAPVLELDQADFTSPVPTGYANQQQQPTDFDLPVHTQAAPFGTGDTATAIKNTISGWGGNFGGTLTIVAALVLSPDFSTAVGQFFARLSRGEGGWGALASLIGAGAIAYRHRPKPKDP